MRIPWFILPVIIFFNTTAAAAQTAQLSSDSNLVETGSRFVLHLAVREKPAEKPDVSGWQDVIPEENRLRESAWTNENGFYKKDITVIFFEEDSLTIPPVRIPLSSGDTAVTNTLDIQILATPAPDEIQDMAPIRDIQREEKIWTDYWPWLAGILVLALLLLAAFFVYKYRKNRGIGSRSIQWPPHELALRKLGQLQQRGLWTSGNKKEYCDELTDIVREYLELRFGVPALESTSTELIQKLKGTDIPDETALELGNVLFQADLAKFAKGTPPPDFGDMSMQFALRLIEITKPVPTNAAS